MTSVSGIVITRYPHLWVMFQSHHDHSPRLFAFSKQLLCQKQLHQCPNLMLCCNQASHPHHLVFLLSPYGNLYQSILLLCPFMGTRGTSNDQVGERSPEKNSCCSFLRAPKKQYEASFAGKSGRDKYKDTPQYSTDEETTDRRRKTWPLDDGNRKDSIQLRNCIIHKLI